MLLVSTRLTSFDGLGLMVKIASVEVSVIGAVAAFSHRHANATSLAVAPTAQHNATTTRVDGSH